jgi:ATP-dependent exoDNAse (exonuclease V) alpha subunit
MKDKDTIILENLYSFALESKNQKVEIEELLPDKNNMEIAVDSLRKGMYASTDKPIEVYLSEDKYIVADGHHRLLQHIINGESSVIIKILTSDKPISRNGTIELDFYAGDYYGLDETLENGWLIKRL